MQRDPSFTVSLVRARPNLHRSRYLCIRSLPIHSWRGENNQLTQSPTTGSLRADDTEAAIHSGDKRFYENMFDQLPRRSESTNALAGTRFVTRIQRCCEVLALSSKSWRSCCGIQPCDQHWMSILRRSRRPNMRRRQPCCHWCLQAKRAKCARVITFQHEDREREAYPTKKDPKKGTETCPFGSSMVSVKARQLFWKEWRGRRDSNSRPLP